MLECPLGAGLQICPFKTAVKSLSGAGIQEAEADPCPCPVVDSRSAVGNTPLLSHTLCKEAEQARRSGVFRLTPQHTCSFSLGGYNHKGKEAGFLLRASGCLSANEDAACTNLSQVNT